MGQTSGMRRKSQVLFSSQVYGEILAAPLDQGAKVVVRKDPARVREIPLEDPGILADIDTPEDYRRFVGEKGERRLCVAAWRNGAVASRWLLSPFVVTRSHDEARGCFQYAKEGML